MAIRMPAPQSQLRPDRTLTVDDWFTLPEDGNQYELFEGALLLMTAPNRRHQKIVGRVFQRLLAIADESGGDAYVAPLGVALGQSIGFLPDLIYITPGRDEILSDRGIEGAPDVVVEVLSPSTRSFDQGTKLRAYLESGVQEIWLVDPDGETVTVRTTDRSETVAFGEPIPSRIIAAGDCGLGVMHEGHAAAE